MHTTATPQSALLGAAPLTLLARYEPNVEGRDFIVGSLHGCLNMLLALLVEMGFDDTKDRLFCTGNLADHGSDSIGCIHLLREKWFFAVAGDHEEMLLRAATDPAFDWSWWAGNGGLWASTIPRDTLLELAELVADVPLAITVGAGANRFNIIHGEFYGPDESLEDVLENISTNQPVPLSLTRGTAMAKGRIDPDCQNGLSLTFCGHAVVEQVSRIGNQVYLNTSAYKAARSHEQSAYGLTIVEPASGRMWQSQSRIM